VKKFESDSLLIYKGKLQLLITRELIMSSLTPEDFSQRFTRRSWRDFKNGVLAPLKKKPIVQVPHEFGMQPRRLFH
jgi:hypothetical protein